MHFVNVLTNRLHFMFDCFHFVPSTAWNLHPHKMRKNWWTDFNSIS